MRNSPSRLHVSFLFAIVSVFIFYLLNVRNDDEDEILISVIMPCYNVRSDWFLQAIQSVSSQSISSKVELVVIDDGSRDPIKLSSSHLSSLGRVTLYRHRKNMGLSAARNTGAVLARGHYIIFLDPDDFMDRMALEKLVILLKGYEEFMPDRNVAYVYPAVIHFNEEQEISRQADYFDSRRLLRQNFVPSFALIRRTIYLDYGGMCEGTIKYFEDYDFWLRLMGMNLRGALLNEPLFYYRRHNEGRSGQIKAKLVENEWKSELERYNQLAFGAKIRLPDQAIDSQAINRLCPCLRRLPKNSILKLWLWRQRLYVSTPKIQKKTITLPKRLSDIVFIVPWLKIGGADYYDLDVIKSLRSINLSVTLITDVLGRDNPLLDEFRSLVPDIYHLSTLTLSNSPQIAIDTVLDMFIQTREPKIVFIRNSMNGYELAKRHSGSGPHFIDIQHLHTSKDTMGWEYTSLPYAHYLSQRIVVSNHLKKRISEIAEEKGKDAGILTVIHPSTHLKVNDEDVHSCVQSDQAGTVMFIGRMDPQKDPLLWAECARRLAAIDETLLFLVIGDGYLRDQMMEELSTIERRVFFLPFIGRGSLSEYMRLGLRRDHYGVIRMGDCPGKTILLMASDNEGLPITLLESAALKVPAVIGNVGAVQELKPHLGELLQIVDDRKPETYVKRILHTLSSPVDAQSVDLPLIFTFESFREKIVDLVQDLLEYKVF